MTMDLGNFGSNEQQLQISVKDAEDVKCESCENIFFEKVTKIKKISKLLIGTADDQFVPVDTYRCSECGNINDEFKI
jgi:predicted nucleic acid-binding Zn ribbon protein